MVSFGGLNKEMKDKIKTIVITVLATLGVLFIIIMLLPDSEDSAAAAEETVTEETAEAAEEEKPDIRNSEEDEDLKETEAATEETDTGNIAEVNIPDSDVSDYKLQFKTSTLNGDIVSDDIFSDYDITVVFVWATYCGNCIDEMDEYAEFYRNLPDNVNLLGMVSDVYDGIDMNRKAAKEIISDAGAEFDNLLISDSLYDVATDIQYVPSTFFVNREGHIVGALLEGAKLKNTKQELGKYIEPGF